MTLTSLGDMIRRSYVGVFQRSLVVFEMVRRWDLGEQCERTHKLNKGQIEPNVLVSMVAYNGVALGIEYQYSIQRYWSVLVTV